MQQLSTWFRKVWLVLFVAGIIIILDQITKSWVRRTIPKFDYTTPIPSIGDYFNFHHVDNYGAAFGIFQGQGNFFIIIAVVVAIAILIYVRYLPMHQRFVRVLLGLQLGGAIGNVIDRIYQGYVTDFIRVGIPGVYYWPNFNIADSAIVTGVIGLGIFILIDDMRRPKAEEVTDEEPSANSIAAAQEGTSTPEA